MTNSCNGPIQLSYFLSSWNHSDMNTDFLCQNQSKTKQNCFFSFTACNCIELKKVPLYITSFSYATSRKMCLVPKELKQSHCPSIQPEGLVDKHHFICDVNCVACTRGLLQLILPFFNYVEGQGGELVIFFGPDDFGHGDVTTSEVRDFAEFSKMALARLLDAQKTNSFSVLVSLQLWLAFFVE